MLLALCQATCCQRSDQMPLIHSLSLLSQRLRTFLLMVLTFFYNIATYKICVNIHALPQRFIGSSHGSGSQTATFLKESKKPNWNFEGVGASSNKNPSVGVWIFSRNTM